MSIFQSPPIGAIIRLRGIDTVLLQRSSMNTGEPLRRPVRGKIKKMSRRSLNNLALMAQSTSKLWKSMLTLTYLSPPVNGKEAKKHLRKLLNILAKRYKNNGLDYLWFMEFTKKQACHFHVLLSVCVPATGSVALGQAWARITNQGEGLYSSLRDRKVRDVEKSIVSTSSHSKTWENLREKDGGAKYVTKYATKAYQKHCPSYWSEIGRFWGLSSRARGLLVEESVIPMTENRLRYILKKHGDKRGDWTSFPKILWGAYEIVSRETIEEYPLRVPA